MTPRISPPSPPRSPSTTPRAQRRERTPERAASSSHGTSIEPSRDPDPRALDVVFAPAAPFRPTGAPSLRVLAVRALNGALGARPACGIAPAFTADATPPDLVRRRMIEPALLDVYRGRPLPPDARVTILTGVLDDGWGDLHAQLETAKRLRALHPQLELHLVTKVRRERVASAKRQMDDLRETDLPIHWAPTDLWGEVNDGHYPQPALETMRNSDVVLQLPVDMERPYRLRMTPDADVSEPTFVKVDEMGSAIRSVDPEKRALGFDRSQLGVVLPARDPALATATRAEALAGLTSRALLASIIGAREPRPEAVAQWLAHAQVGFAYVRRAPDLLKFILASAVASDGAERSELALCVPAEALAGEVEGRALWECLTGEGAAADLLRSAGFATVREGALSSSIHEGAAVGRTLTLHRYQGLPKADVHRLIAAGQLAVGCTGDASLVDALGGGRLPFYEVLRHKGAAFRALVDLAGTAVRSPVLDAFLGALLEAPSSLSAIAASAAHLGALARDPELSSATRSLTQVVAEEHDAALRISGLVSRAVLARRHPALRVLDAAAETAVARHGAHPRAVAKLQALERALDASAEDVCSR